MALLLFLSAVVREKCSRRYRYYRAIAIVKWTMKTLTFERQLAR